MYILDTSLYTSFDLEAFAYEKKIDLLCTSYLINYRTSDKYNKLLLHLWTTSCLTLLDKISPLIDPTATFSNEVCTMVQKFKKKMLIMALNACVASSFMCFHESNRENHIFSTCKSGSFKRLAINKIRKPLQGCGFLSIHLVLLKSRDDQMFLLVGRMANFKLFAGWTPSPLNSSYFSNTWHSFKYMMQERWRFQKVI